MEYIPVRIVSISRIEASYKRPLCNDVYQTGFLENVSTFLGKRVASHARRRDILVGTLLSHPSPSPSQLRHSLRKELRYYLEASPTAQE